MALVLFLHPLASFCQKVLIAFHENGTAFEPRIVDLMDPADRARFLDLWPLGKIPVLRDEARDRTIPETTIIIEYLEQQHPGARPLLPEDPAARLDARLWDRFHDLYVQAPLQKIVIDRLRPEDARDPSGVAEARAALRAAYAVLERRMAGRRWAAGDAFSLADCAAAPALFYAGCVEPFAETHPHLAAYFDRLVERPSVWRVIEGARPYFPMFPFAQAIPARFRAPEAEAR